LRSGPVSRVLSRTIIPLGVQSLIRSSDLPESSTGRASGFLFGLASGGVYLAVNCYQTRGALLPHPFTLTSRMRRSTLCCTCRRLSPPRRYLAPCPMKPGLSSPASVTETSTAATVQPTSRRILSKFKVNCLYFFALSIFYIFPSVGLVTQHDWDQEEYNQLDKIVGTAVCHDDPRTLYKAQDQSHRLIPPYKLLHWDIQAHRHHN